VEQLKLLVRLQTVDKVLFDLEQEASEIPLRLEELDQKEERLIAALAQLQEKLEEMSGRRRQLETEAEDIKSRLRRAENRLMGAKTQREYRAANAEIEEGRDAAKSLDDLLLDVMEQAEALEHQVTAAKQQMEAFEAEAGDARKKLKSRQSSVTREVNKLNKDRVGLCDGVEKKLMDEYDFIRTRRQGVAMAPVSQGTCLACHMQLPPQQFNELQRQDKVMSCPSCRRIIYWADSEPFGEDE